MTVESEGDDPQRALFDAVILVCQQLQANASGMGP